MRLRDWCEHHHDHCVNPHSDMYNFAGIILSRAAIVLLHPNVPFDVHITKELSGSKYNLVRPHLIYVYLPLAEQVLLS